MDNYNSILTEMEEELSDFSKKSDELSAYDYENQFRSITDKYDKKLFQASLGRVPKSKNEKKKIQTSFGVINVKKKIIP